VKTIAKCLIILAGLLSITGCWDMKTIQLSNFVNVLGIDYKEEEGQFIVYAQVNEYAAIAKVDGSPKVEDMQAIGKGVGRSISLAMDDLHHISQVPTVWTQIRTVVFSENALNKGLLNWEDELMRTRDLRYSPWVFATREPLDNMLKVEPVVGSSLLATLLYQPDKLFHQQSIIPNIRLQGLVRSAREPAETTLIPSLNHQENWKQGDKTRLMPYIDGAFAIYRGENKGWFSREDLNGVKWTREETVNALLPIKDEGERIASVNLTKPKVKKKITIQDGKPQVELDVHVRGEIREQQKPMESRKLIEAIEANVKKEIDQTYQAGSNRRVDLYSFEEVAYKRHLNWWSTWNEQGTRNYPLQTITVHVIIESPQMLNLRQ
jgi:spore germination protein KC